MVVPLRSQARLRLSLAHWTHRQLLQPLAALPLSSPLHRGAFWLVALSLEVALSKSLLFPEGKREVARRSRDGGIQKGGVTAQP